MQDITVETKDTTSRDMTGWGQTHTEDKNKKTKTENSRGMLALYTGDILLESVCEGVCVCVDSNSAYTYITAGTVGSTLVPIIDSKQWFPPQLKVVWSTANQPLTTNTAALSTSVLVVITTNLHLVSASQKLKQKDGPTFLITSDTQ